MKMSCPSEELDAFARGELSPLPAQRLNAHVRGCAACRDELSWLRAERRLADEHARSEGRPPPELWQAVASRVAPKPPLVRRTALAGRGVLIAALASAALALASWQRTRPPSPEPGAVVRPEPPAASLPALAPAPVPASAAPEPVVLRTLNVSKAVARPVTLSLFVGETTATVEVSSCGGGDVSVAVSDTRHHALALATRPASGKRGEHVELRVDDGLLLESGQARVVVPRGTRLEVTTAAGEHFVTEVTAPTRVVGVSRPP